MKILISDNLSEKGVNILRDAGFDVDVKTGMKPDELKACIGQYNGIVIRSATKLTADVIEHAENLKVIGRAGSGLDNVDKPAATKKGIVVMNTPGGNTVTTAEHSIALMVSLARNVPQATGSMKAGKWEKKKFMGVEMYNKTLGIVGLGQIGSQVARKALGLEMNVIAFDPFLSEEKAEELGIKKVEVKEIFERSDFITFHTPLTPETKNLVNSESIATMKKGVRIINCARGGIINEADLLDALNSGHVAGAAMDVFETEPPGQTPFIEHENLICTPHLGAATDEAQVNVAVAVAEQIVDYLKYDTIRNAVNFPSIPQDQVLKLQPFIVLAEGLGSFAAQAFEGGAIEQISVEFSGEAAELNTESISIAALKGVLTPVLQESVNFVNAPLIAEERAIKVKETTSKDAGDYHSMVTLQLKSGKVSQSFAGTLFSRKDPRIIMVDGFPVEIIPSGNILVINNNDKPGVIGNIGGMLANHGINIAWMHFGRQEAGGRAISVVSVDTPVSDEQMKEIRDFPNILSAKRVYL